MSAYILSTSGVISLQFILDNTTVQSITAGNPIQFYNAGGNEPGFVPIGCNMQYISAPDQFEASLPGCYILTTTDIVCSYVAPLGSLLLTTGQTIVFLTGYEPAGPLYSAPDDFKKLAIGFDGNYISGLGELKITLFGVYQY